jgi:hypothetical protein
MFDKIITGVGARKASEANVNLAFDLGRYISDRNILLRTGDAKEGMDTAFLEGWLSGSKVGDCIVYGPNTSYSAKTGESWDTLYFSNYDEAVRVVSEIVPHWNTVYRNIKESDFERYTKKVAIFRKLQIRNYFQVMGDINSKLIPSDLVLFCAKKLGGIYVGGTATTINIAREVGVELLDVSECSREHIIDTINRINFKLDDDIIPF